MTFANEYNFSSRFSSTVASYASICMVLGKLTIGPVYDKIGYRWTLNLLLLFEMSLIVFTFFYGDKEWGFVIVLFCTFWIYGAHLSSYIIISQRLFGVNNGPKVFSIMAFGLMFSSFIGASAANVLLALFGYKNIFIYFLGSTFASLVIFCLYRPNIKKFRETFEEHYDPSKA
jgi:predicted MFS family arabinose efflux permease